ncbi:hypothetical protein DFH09DRAFT_1133115 [Mycena vulgaris]|nr:hypothetical protein DFH09DRAFT_1133115 [Mycena vulgaris]
MALDRRRINGPDESFPPVFHSDAPQSSLADPRKDRSPSDIRPIFLQPGLISQANGSAYIETAKTKIACADAEDRSIAVAIHQALVSSVRLELLPKSTIDIFITIIESDGLDGCVASGSVAASTALADAGIELLGLVTSCAASVVGKEIWLDPTEEEARLSNGTLVLACMPALKKITSVWQTGEMKVAEALGCMDACQEKCTEIHSVVAQALLESAKT